MPSGVDTMLSLRAEIAACLFAVALLGLLAGWMMQRSRGARRLRQTVATWETRYAELEDRTQRDASHLEERLQALAGELRELKSENRQLRESSRDEGDTLDNARAEAIERNRRQAETQEKLQRIISEREGEIATLRAELDTLRRSSTRDGDEGGAARVLVMPAASATPADGNRRLLGVDDAAADAVTIADAVTGTDVVAGANDVTGTDDVTTADAGTDTTADGESIADTDADAVTERFDETIRMDPSQLPGTALADREEPPLFKRDLPEDPSPEGRTSERHGRTFGERLASENAPGKHPTDDGREDVADETLDSTMDIGLLDAEEATVALDEKTLALVRGIGSGRKG